MWKRLAVLAVVVLLPVSAMAHTKLFYRMSCRSDYRKVEIVETAVTAKPTVTPTVAPLVEITLESTLTPEATLTPALTEMPTEVPTPTPTVEIIDPEELPDQITTPSEITTTPSEDLL